MNKINNDNEERLQKALARAGIASRRACEELISAGRVKVNGKVVTQLGIKINPEQDKILVDDSPVAVKSSGTPRKIYLMLNKPEGYLSTVTDPQGRPTIMDLVDTDERLYPVGRLDADTSGLLLLTNDGAFANALMHPRFGVEKEYAALLEDRPAMRLLEDLRRGVAIPVENSQTGEMEEQTTLPARVDLISYEGSNTLVRFVIKEGKKRQIRLMARAIGSKVLELKRVRFGPLSLDNLAEGQTRALSKIEIQALLQIASGEQAETKPKEGRFHRAPASSPNSGRTPARRPAAPGFGAGREDNRPAHRPAAAGGFRARPDDRGGRPEQGNNRGPNSFRGRPDESGRPERDERRSSGPNSFRARPDDRGGRPERDERRSSGPSNFRGQPDGEGGRPERRDAGPGNFRGRPENRSAGPDNARPGPSSRPNERRDFGPNDRRSSGGPNDRGNSGPSANSRFSSGGGRPDDRRSAGPEGRRDFGPNDRRNVGPANRGPNDRRSAGPNDRRDFGPSDRRSSGPTNPRFSPAARPDERRDFGPNDRRSSGGPNDRPGERRNFGLPARPDDRRSSGPNNFRPAPAGRPDDRRSAGPNDRPGDRRNAGPSNFRPGPANRPNDRRDFGPSDRGNSGPNDRRTGNARPDQERERPERRSPAPGNFRGRSDNGRPEHRNGPAKPNSNPNFRPTRRGGGGK